MSWAHYLLQVNIYLVIFYCFYKLLLDKETYFVLNRIYLIASGALSLAIPFLRFEWFTKQEVAKPIFMGAEQLNDFVTQVTIIDDTTEKFNWGNLIVFIYLLGILFFIGRLIFQLLAVKKLFSTIGNGAAFSFFRKKIISTNVPEIATINKHEDIHIKQLHTLDVLFFEFIGIVAWFNPIIYLYKKTIKNIHEYLADEAAAKFQGDKETYALLLLSQAFGIQPNSLTNRFFTKSLIKKRIFMLHKQRSKKTAILKYGLFVPLFAITLVLSSATIRKNNQILAISEKIPLNEVNDVVNQVIAKPLSVINLSPPPPTKLDQAQVQDLIIKNEVSTFTSSTTLSDAEASKSSWNSFYKYLSDGIKYPAEAVKKKIQGNSIINFSVRRGKVFDISIQNELGAGCEDEVIDQISNYDDFFQKDGNYSLKTTFKLQGYDGPMKNENAESSADFTNLGNITITAFAPKEEATDLTVYNFVALSNPPTYPGGMAKFYEFLSKNVKYPQIAADNDIEGKVLASFTVEKDGSLTDIKIERKLGFGTDEEAVRVLKLGKRWNPGIQNGKSVRVKYNIPISFKLDQRRNEAKVSLASIRLKNYNQTDAPMVIVDGDTKEALYLKTLNANTIESISILKDANAIALYGKEAKNGVVLVTTKKPKPKLVKVTLTNRN